MAAGTGSTVWSVVAGKERQTGPAFPLSHGPPPLPLAAPGSGKPPVCQGEHQRSPELNLSCPLGTFAHQHQLDGFWL